MIELPTVVFVTGTDTGVGKTIATAALAVVLGRSGKVAVVKPAQTGVRTDEPGDLHEIGRLSGVAELYEGVRLPDPLAPTTAARVANVLPPAVDEHARTIATLAEYHDHVLVEGAGGLLVGLDAAGNNLADLAQHVRCPFTFLIVTRPTLGTLNHTALTTEALRSRNLPAAGLIIGSWPAFPDLAERHNLTDLPETTGLPILAHLPPNASQLSPPTFRTQSPTWFTTALATRRRSDGC